ncbi:hypothetical protein EDB19DRAFT_1961988 [Suillus lakei]|nr:hypothetical protein EDB19DRAFT_1961988 [Suillus lakei]
MHRVGAAITGLTSIHAYGTEEAFEQKSLNCIDHYTKSRHMFCNLNHWVFVRIDIIGSGFSAGLAAFLVYGHGVHEASNIGLSLNMAGKSYLHDVPIANFRSHLKVGFSSMVCSAAASPTPASVTPSASAPAANKLSLFPTSSTLQIAPAAQASSFGPPTTQPPTTTTAPTTTSAPSIPNFFAKPVPPSTPAPATTTPPTVPSFYFGPTPAQTLFTAPAPVSTNPLPHRARKLANQCHSPSPNPVYYFPWLQLLHRHKPTHC